MQVNFVAKYKIDEVENYSTIEECVEFFSNKTIVGLDIETTKNKEVIGSYNEDVYKGGLDPYLSNVVMIQLGTLDHIFVIDVRDYTKEELKPITDFLNWNKEVTFVGQNLKFESKFLKCHYNIDLFQVHDCMIVEMVLTNGLQGKYSLAALAQRYLGIGEQDAQPTLFDDDKVVVTMDEDVLEGNEYAITPFEVANQELIDKSTRLEFVHIGDRPFTAKQVLYGADDVIFPLLIRDKQLSGRLLPDGTIYKPHRLYNLENNMVMVLADMEVNGMPINTDMWIALAEKAEVEWKKRLDELDKYVQQFYPKFVEEPNLFDYERRCTIEWTSSKQVIQLFRHLDICPQVFSTETKKKEYTVGATALKKTLSNKLKKQYDNGVWKGFDTDEKGLYIEDNDLLTLNYLLAKKSEQLATTFGKKWLRYVHPITGRVHANFRQILNSGRMASSSPNMQNLPKGDYRPPFSIEKGTLIFSDYSSQELRVAGSMSNDRAMLDFFYNGHPIYGEDMHTFTANLINRIDNPNAPDLPHKDSEEFDAEMGTLRDRSKILSFSILYGKSSKGFSEDFGTTEEEAEALIQGYLDAYPNIRVLMEEGFKSALKNKYIQIDPLLDRRWFSTDFDKMEKLNEEARSYYPKEYFDWRVPKEIKAQIKEEVTELYPEVRGIWREFFAIRGSIERKSTNYRVQGSSSNMTKSALVLLRQRKINQGYTDLYLINTIHDEIGIEIRSEGNIEKYEKLMLKCMEDAGDLVLDHKGLIKAEAGIGKYWVH